MFTHLFKLGLVPWVTGILVLVAAAQESPPPQNPHGSFQEECALCHGPQGWTPIQLRDDFDHDRYGMALGGSHEQLYCGFCHQNLEFTGLTAECADCHHDVHDGEFGRDCQRCHSDRSFQEYHDMVRMHRVSSFPLTGAHVGIGCEQCHVPSTPGRTSYIGTSTDCGTCHLDAYLAATPSHVVSGFPTDCKRCHDTQDWQGARFDHSLVTAACVDCHRDDYDATTNPVHAPPLFPIDCDACHNTNTWLGAAFDHEEFFPLNRDPHREEWRECSDCHTSPSNYAIFTCLSCHPHSDRQETDDKHKDEGSDYFYESVACYDCHPDGRKP